MKVLIADDSAGIRMKLRRYFEELGHSVVAEACNGLQAVELFISAKPELITLDLVMPEADGIYALREIRKEKPDARVVMITSAATVANMSEVKRLGALHFVVKPFQKEQIALMLEQISKIESSGEAA